MLRSILAHILFIDDCAQPFSLKILSRNSRRVAFFHGIVKTDLFVSALGSTICSRKKLRSDREIGEFIIYFFILRFIFGFANWVATKRRSYMKMQTTRWNRRRCSFLACALLVLYWLFSVSNNTYESDVTIKNVKPEIVWEYVADFHKMRLLNPTM